MTTLPGSSTTDRPLLKVIDGRWVLLGSDCPHCHRTWYPPRALCPHDLTETEDVVLSGNGTVYAAIEMHAAPQGFQAPYWVAYVDLPEGVRVFAQLTWAADSAPKHGDAVTLTTGVVRTEPTPIMGMRFVPA